MGVAACAAVGMLYVLFNIYSYSSSAAPPPTDLPAGVIAVDGRFVLRDGLPGLMVWAGYAGLISAVCVALLLMAAFRRSRRGRFAHVVLPPPRGFRAGCVALAAACVLPVVVVYVVTVSGALVVASVWGVATGTSWHFWSLMTWMAGRGLILALLVSLMLALLAQAVEGAAAALSLVLVYWLVAEPILRSTVIGYRFLVSENVKVWLSLPGDSGQQGLRDIGVLGGPVLLAYAGILTVLLTPLARKKVLSRAGGSGAGIAV